MPKKSKKAARKPKMPPLSEQLRGMIIDSGLSVYRVAKDSGVPQPVLHRFVAGERDMYLETADRLAAYFGVGLRKR